MYQLENKIFKIYKYSIERAKNNFFKQKALSAKAEFYEN